MAEPKQSNRNPSVSEKDTLESVRDRIDWVDRAILDQLNKRAQLVLAIGEIKKSGGISVYQEDRERRIVAGLSERNPGPFPNEGISPVFREIISATRSLEQGLSIAYMGPEGTFSHLAASERFGRLAQLVPVASIAEVFAAVGKGTVGFGVVPVENTTEGVVTQTLDSLVENDVSVCGEMMLRIANHLVSKSGRIEDVKTVVSNPQPLAQCRQWLERNLPGVARSETLSTTAAAQLAVEEGSLAAICSSMAAEVYGLRTIEASIEDRRDNTTRFLVIGRQLPEPTGNDLTLAVFAIRKDEPGGLYRLLQPFADAGINLTSIQIRPIKGKPWEYRFFLDMKGHCSEERVMKALEAVASTAHSHRVLGSFPRAQIDRDRVSTYTREDD